MTGHSPAHSAQYPLARRRRPVPAATLCREPFVVRETGSSTKSVVERALAERGLSVNPVMSLGSTEAIKRAVAAGVGVAIASQLTVQQEPQLGRLAVLRVPDLPIHRPLHRLTLCWPSSAWTGGSATRP